MTNSIDHSYVAEYVDRLTHRLTEATENPKRSFINITVKTAISAGMPDSSVHISRKKLQTFEIKDNILQLRGKDFDITLPVNAIYEWSMDVPKNNPHVKYRVFYSLQYGSTTASIVFLYSDFATQNPQHNSTRVVSIEQVGGSDAGGGAVQQKKPENTKKSTRQCIHVCMCWPVKGHYRHLRSGKITWVKAHERGRHRNEAMSLCA